MSTLNTCPDQGKLARYARDDVGPEDTTELDEHLVECRECLNRLLELGRRADAPEVPGCHVVREIGRGRFGVVYKAWSLGDKPRVVALKVLSQTGTMERDRFDREIAVLKKLDSPGIVKCLDSGTAGPLTYLVMEHVEGVHLDEYLETSSLDLNGKLAVFQNVCRAVADAHAGGVVHRDLKPRNILVDAEGRPHVLDFGVCSVHKEDWSSAARGTITNPGDVIGTLKFMSPEQAWGGAAGAIDEKSDVWALGVMLYGILTDGGYPYSLRGTVDKPAQEALLERIRKELPHIPKLDSLPRGRDLEILLQRSLAWESDRRLRTAADLANDLERYCDGRRIRTRPLWFPYRLKRLAVAVATRSRGLFSLMFISSVALTLCVSAVCFDVGWLVTGHRYAGGDRSAVTPSPWTDARDGIAIVGVFDETAEVVLDFAQQNQFADVTSDIKSWRAVHGALMERFVAARPRAVAWDYYFQSRQAGDPLLAAGIEKLQASGVPVVLASLTYTEDGIPRLSPDVTGALGRLHHGAIEARDQVGSPGEFVTVIRKQGGSLVPSLALTTLAAVLHPEARLDLEWARRGAPIDLLYEIHDGAYRRERHQIHPTKSFKAGNAGLAFGVGDLLGCSTFELRRPEFWDRRTIHYETLLRCTAEELRSAVGGKVVLIGDFRRPRWGFGGDGKRVKYGTEVVANVPGCYLLADAIAGLLSDRYLELAFIFSPAEFTAILAAAVAGCLLPVWWARTSVLRLSGRRRTLWVGLFAATGLSFGALLLADSYAGVHAAMFGFALVTPMIGSFWVEFTRNRHRIADADISGSGFSEATTVGTITLRQQPAKSRRETK